MALPGQHCMRQHFTPGFESTEKKYSYYNSFKVSCIRKQLAIAILTDNDVYAYLAMYMYIASYWLNTMQSAINDPSFLYSYVYT